MATGPQDIQPHLDDVADALIERDMRAHGFLPANGGWYDNQQTVMTDPDNPVMPGWVPGPGGGATGLVQTGQGFEAICGESQFNPSADVYEHWPQWVADTFAPFLDCPLESDYGTLRDFLRQGTEKLSRQTVLDESSGSFTYSENGDLGSALTNGTADLGDLEGEAMDAFRQHYWGRLEGIFDRYSLVARMLWVLAEGEADLWHNYWNDVEQISVGLPESIRFPASGEIPFGTIATITGLLGKVPVVGSVFGAVSGVASTLGSINDLVSQFGHEPARPAFNMPDDAPGCAAEVERLLRKLSDDTRDQEEGFTSHARNVEAETAGSDFSLERPTPLLDADQVSDVVQPGQPGTIAFTRSEISDARNYLEQVAVVLDDAQLYNRVSIARFAFTRPAEVGRAQLGPYNAMDNACERLNQLCSTNATTLRQVSEVLRTVAEQLLETDEAVVAAKFESLAN